MTTEKALNGKPDAGNPHVLFDEREVASVTMPRRGALLYNMKKLTGKTAILAAAIAASAILPARAGSIVWEGAQNITGTGDARTEGTLLYAYAKGTATLNGVPFADGLSTASAAQTSYIPNNAASPQDIKLYGNGDSIQATTQNMSAPAGCDILKSFVYNSTANIMTVTLQNLTEGHRYLVQLWVQDSRNNTNLRTRYVRPDGNAAAQAQYYVSSTGYGQHVTGIFVATGTTQDFTLNPGASKGTACAQINAIQVRDLGVGGIAWEEAQNITGTGDVRTEGTLLYAYAKGTATLNGVAFADGFTDGFSTSTGTATNFIPSNAETPKDIEVSVGTPGVVLHTTQALSVPTGCDILKNFIYDVKETTATVTLRNLVAGRRYLVQFWANDTRTSGNCKTRFEVVDGVNVVKYCNGSYGQHITGTFTAADDTQSFTLTPQRGSSTSGSAQINAIQVRDLGAIDWEPAQNITGTGDVNTAGTLLYAYALGTATLNGVAFADGFTTVSGTGTTCIPNNADSPKDIEFSLASGDVGNTTQPISVPSGCDILKSFIYGSYDVGATVTLRNLTPGNRYLVQFWVHDPRTSGNIKSRLEIVDSGYAVKYCNGSYGQHITGLFTAAADSVFFTLTPQKGSAAYGAVQINAIQVRDLGNPAEKTTQTWSGAAGTSLSWNGQNWDGNANVWTIGNDAVFATDGAIADVDSDTVAASMAFEGDATVTGTGTIIAPEVNVADGKTATIGAQTSGALEKTGAGTLVLGSSRSAVTTLSEGTLELSGTASLNMANFTFGTDAAKPVTLRVGPTATLANNSGTWDTGAGVTSTVIKEGGDWAFSGSLLFGNDPDAAMTFRHEGGTLSAAGWIALGNVAGAGLSTMVVDGGTVSSTWAGTDAANPFRIVIGTRADGRMVVTGGAALNSASGLSLGYGNDANGTLDISDGGIVAVNGDVIFGYASDNAGSGTVNLGEGGTLVADTIRTHDVNSIPAVINFDGGTLKARSDGKTLIHAHADMSVKIGANGGTIDANGKFAYIGSEILSGVDGGTDGGMTFKGGGTVSANRLRYAGKTTVEIGTTLRLMKADDLCGGLVVTLPEDATGETLPNGVYKVVVLFGENETFPADVLEHVVVPSGVSLRVADTGRSIVCVHGEDPGFVWIGGASGSLGDAVNWANGHVPTNGTSCFIASAVDANLTVAGDFAPSSITFSQDSAAVTITGAAISGMSAITNLSVTTHVFNVPVAFADEILVVQKAKSWDSRANSSIRFAGGVTGTTFADGTSRYLNGAFTLSDVTGWVANTYGSDSRWGIPAGSSLTIPVATDTHELALGDNATAGGAFTTGVMRTSARLSCWNAGECVVTDELVMTLPNGDLHLCYDYSVGHFKFEKVTLGSSGDAYKGFYFSASYASSQATTRNVWIGAGGLQFTDDANLQAVYVIGNRVGDVTYVRPWHSDYAIAAKDGIKRDIHIRRETHFGTTDENGVARTVTANGIFDESGTMHIDGAGRFVVNAVNTYSGAVRVNDTATLAVNAGKKVTSGAITVGATATLEVAQSGTVALGGNLSLADGATLAFNYTDKAVPVLDATDKTVTFGSTSNIVVKVSAADGKRARGGANVLTSGGKFANANVTLATGAPDWAKGVMVVDGEIVLNVRPSGMVIIVK